MDDEIKEFCDDIEWLLNNKDQVGIRVNEAEARVRAAIQDFRREASEGGLDH